MNNSKDNTGAPKNIKNTYPEKGKNLYIHIDADAFFASVEQCVHHELSRKPVVAGRNGSIVVAVSYEAKKLGVERGLAAHEILRDFPSVYLVASDYDMYQIFSDRMVSIAQSFLGKVIRTSVDEMKSSVLIHSDQELVLCLEQLQTLQKTLARKLGLSFSFGIGDTKTMAKIASGMHKPSGFTYLGENNNLQEFMKLSVEKVPGFGRQTSPRLRKLGIATIQQFITYYPSIASNFSVTMQEIHDELQGIPRVSKTRQTGKSINRARSFKVTYSYEEIKGQITKNLEHLVQKLRNHGMQTKQISVNLRNAERQSMNQRVSLPISTDDYFFLSQQTLGLLQKIYQPGQGYRYASVTLGSCEKNSMSQPSLFTEVQDTKQKNSTIWKAIDSVNSKHGKRILSLADGLRQPLELGSHLSQNHPMIVKTHPLLPGEASWRRLSYPFLGRIS
jgi:DNA polymerase-4